MSGMDAPAAKPPAPARVAQSGYRRGLRRLYDVGGLTLLMDRPLVAVAAAAVGHVCGVVVAHAPGRGLHMGFLREGSGAHNRSSTARGWPIRV